MKNKRIEKLIIILMLLLVCSCSEKKTNESEEKTLNLVSAYDFYSLDVSKNTDGYMCALNIFDRLFDMKLQEDGTSIIVPNLCENYSVSEDGLTYTFEIKHDVVFSNGSPLTADDVKYTFERLLLEDDVNTEIPSEVLGADDIFEGKTQTLEGFVINDDYSFSITLYNPNPAFIAELTSIAVGIVDKETVENAEDFGTSSEVTVGTGAYKLQEWEIDDHVTLVYNDKYWGEEPDIKKCVIKIVPEIATQDLMFQNGEVDILCLSTMDASIIDKVYKEKYADSMIITPQVGLRYFAMNENQKYLSDVRVRKAIQKAIDVDSIVDNIFGEYAKHEHGLIPTGTIGHNDNIRSSVYDPEEARRILQEAGYKEGEIELELAFDSSDTEAYVVLIQMIIQNLNDIGIHAIRKDYEDSTWYEERLEGNLDSYISAWAMDYNDPANIMVSFFKDEETSKSRSFNYYDLQTMDRVANAMNITNQEERIKEFQDLEDKIIVQDAALVPMFEIYIPYVKGSRIADMVPFWSGYENTFDLKEVKYK